MAHFGAFQSALKRGKRLVPNLNTFGLAAGELMNLIRSSKMEFYSAGSQNIRSRWSVFVFFCVFLMVGKLIIACSP